MMFTDVRWRLSGMMFLLYFSLGSWAVTLSSYLMMPAAKGGLSFSADLVGWTYSTFAFAGMLAPIVIGPLADRWFRAERLMFVSNVVGGLLLFVAGWWCWHQSPIIADARDAQGMIQFTQRVLFVVLLAYCFFLLLAITLANVVTLQHHPAGASGYSRTRMWGTGGWIVAGNVITWLLDPVSPEPFYLAAGSSILLGIFSLTLPFTPPRSRENKLLPALRLLALPSFMIFVVVAFLATVMNQFYGVYMHKTLKDYEVSSPEQILTLGQVLEMGCMFVIPWLLPEKRIKWLMLIGLAGWVLRGFVMVYGSKFWILAVAVPMHGWSFAFYFIVAQVFIKRVAPADLMAGTQGIVSFASSGLGAWVGNLLSGWMIARYTVTSTDWAAVWVAPLIGCVVAFVLFLAFFRTPPSPSEFKSEG
ncbi:MAG: MFS transporter [Fimbriiglobus sp.]